MTMKTKIKICGLTNLNDALAAIQAGADYLGFIFTRQSKRQVDPQTVREIIAGLPANTSTVGVFVNQAAEVINQIINYCKIRIVQLHGDETDKIVNDLSGAEEIWKTVWLTKPEDFTMIFPSRFDALVADTANAVQRGGTGQIGNWTLAAKLASQHKTVLAGGLTPNNVAMAVQEVKPFAVDVASGVERCPGQKDHDKIQDFCRSVNES